MNVQNISSFELQERRNPENPGDITVGDTEPKITYVESSLKAVCLGEREIEGTILLHRSDRLMFLVGKKTPEDLCEVFSDVPVPPSLYALDSDCVGANLLEQDLGMEFEQLQNCDRGEDEGCVGEPVDCVMPKECEILEGVPLANHIPQHLPSSIQR